MIIDKIALTMLAFGCGVQTVAEMVINHAAYDYIVMSDPGDEKKETYEYLKEIILPWLEKTGVDKKFFVVKNNKYSSLYEYCMINQQVPMRNFRWCTDKFKRIPLNKFAKRMGATRKNPCEKAIGISIDESHRVNEGKAQDEEPQYIKVVYPLIDRKISRKDCYQIIKDAGLPVPVKSGCWYCPFAKKEEWRRLKIDQPELYDKAMIMEENNKKFPERTIKFTKPLRMLNFNYSLTDFGNEPEELESCDSGHCMT